MDKSQDMRDLVAATILSDSVKYSRKFLASMKEPHEYAAWICNGKNEWGGVPELKVLSIYYNKIFCVVDQDISRAGEYCKRFRRGVAEVVR